MTTENTFLELTDLAEHCFDGAKAKGFHDRDLEPNRVAAYIANLHGEVSELWEAYRQNALHEPCDKSGRMHELGLPRLTNAEEELADILIRTLDTAHGLKIDIGVAVATKLQYNETRPWRHGKVA